jgi:hypothetical protein
VELIEINELADDLLAKLRDSTSAADVRDLVFRLDGLYRGVRIKSAALSTGPCMDQAPTVYPASIVSCVLLAGHAGGHRDGQGMSWSGPPAPTCGFKWKWGQGREQHYEVCTLPAGHDGTHHLNQVTGINKRKVDCTCVWATRQAMSESNTLAGSHHDDTCALYLRNFGEVLPDSSKCGFGGTCTLPAKHVGAHLPLRLASAVKPISDRLHELVSHARTCEEGAREAHGVTGDDSYNQGLREAYGVMADRLEDLLMEGGI